MKQFGTILGFELKSYLKNKIFVGITLAMIVLIIGVMFFPRVRDFIGPIGPDTPDDKPVMLVKAQDSAQADLVQQLFAAAFPDHEVRITTDATDAIREDILQEDAECAFVMTSPTAFTYLVNNLSIYDTNAQVAGGVLQQLYQLNAMIGGGMTPDQAQDVMNIRIDSTVESLGKDQAENFFYTYIMIFALYTVILLYGQMVATNVATEKGSRAMEVLVTSAKPTAMMFGKVLASCLAGLLQLIAIFGSALVCYQLNKGFWSDNMIVTSIFSIPLDLLVYMLLFFVLGFLIYAFLYGAIGSTATKLEDINTSTPPLMFVFMIAFLVVTTSMSTGDVDNLAMRICSFIPFTSPMAMFTRIALSTVPWHEIAISVAILAVSAVGIGYLSAKIYRVGVLLCGTAPKMRDILKMLWTA